MLKLAERMVMSFCGGVTASAAHQWTTLSGSGAEDVRVMTRKSVDDPGRPPGIVLNAATSFWLPVPPKRVFDFLRDESSRSEASIHPSTVHPYDLVHRHTDLNDTSSSFTVGHTLQWRRRSGNGSHRQWPRSWELRLASSCQCKDRQLVGSIWSLTYTLACGNVLILLLTTSQSTNSNQSNMLILQESCTDASGSYVIYAPVDVVAMNVVLNGGDPDYVALLPSGFAILPDGPTGSSLQADSGAGTGGSLLTVAFQILVDSVPTAKLSLGSVATVNSLIACTVERIKAAVSGEGNPL
jgi:homeobox-leucine zipper protein